MDPIYDDIGINYSVTRCTDPKIAQQLYAELQGATRIVNIGAGTGSYEPENIDLVAVEPSSKMIAQRTMGSHPVEQAFAEKLPFDNRSFSHAMTVLSMHHWENRPLAFSEINRVATEKFVTITWDPHSEPFWLTRDYFPEIHEMDRQIFPDLDELNEYFDEVTMRPLPIPSDCQDGFFAAFWKRPAAYLSHQVRQSMSPFAKIKDLSAGLQKLEDDLASGVWAKNNHAILDLSSLDVGYRLISAKVRNG
ncbi:MAG: class I SAM-dependent methyltransferase [Anaerolineaceae bacterium]|nr:class I SAM-dependent methyltransferase [Anaerolineaceae bacterium]MCB9100323.1 class I SAM-dependent methyltransferase [Anaerolineales bacterium]